MIDRGAGEHEQQRKAIDHGTQKTDGGRMLVADHHELGQGDKGE